MSSDSSDVEVPDLQPQMLIGRYLMVREIGYGAYSSVWMGFDVQTSQFCALKIGLGDAEDSLQLEVDVGALFANKVVERSYVSVPHDSFQFTVRTAVGPEEHFCTVFRLYGGSLLNVLSSPRYSRGLPLMVALRLLSQLLRALDEVHNRFKVLHTDIRPDNILVSDVPAEYAAFMAAYRAGLRAALAGRTNLNPKMYEALNRTVLARLQTSISRSSRAAYRYELGPRSFCVLHDFGLVRDDEESPLGGGGTKHEAVSVLDYRAPENIMGLPATRACDVWSLGCVFFQMLTGKNLFDPDNLDDGPRDGRMLQLIFAVVGYPPDAVIAASPRREELFVQRRRRFTLRVDQPAARRVTLRELLAEHSPARLSKRSADLALGLLQKLLHSDPEVRHRLNYSAAVAEIHSFLRSHGEAPSPDRRPLHNCPDSPPHSPPSSPPRSPGPPAKRPAPPRP